MKARMAVLMAVLVVSACSSVQPVPVAAGDICFRCRKVISDTKLAGEIVDKDGRAYKFRTAGCMAKFIKTNPMEGASFFATDFSTGRMVKANAATYVPTMIGEGSERTLDYVAYSQTNVANDAAGREKTTPVDWSKLVETIATN